MSSGQMSVRFGILATVKQKEGLFMNLDEFKTHVLATRKASQAEAMSVLSATIQPQPEKKEE